MQKNKYPAQIGVIAVVLTTILLAIGVSVSTRITQEAVQNAERTESTQTFNVAEGGVETGGTGTDNVDVVSNIVGDNAIYLSAGESVEIKLDGTMPDIFWNLNTICSTSNKGPALLISYYPDNTTVQYYPISGFGADCNRDGYLSSVDPGSGSVYKNKYSNADITGGRIRIKALFTSTHIQMAGLVDTTRSAAQDELSGEQVRVVEQRQTDPAAPSVMDYALFAGTGNLQVTEAAPAP